MKIVVEATGIVKPIKKEDLQPLKDELEILIEKYGIEVEMWNFKINAN